MRDVPSPHGPGVATDLTPLTVVLIDVSPIDESQGANVMSLRSYQWPRLVILKPKTSVLEAARALDNNQVGAIVVQHEGRVAGIVTDRDLAVRVLGQGLDARDTTLAKVTTVDVVTLPPDASRTEAMRMMQERRIRRIPLVSEGAVVGVVTLDDLLADEAASLEDFADVVRAQVGDGGPMAPTRLEIQAVRRRASRLDASYRRFVNEFRTESTLPSVDQADAALMIVLSALVRRLTADEAKTSSRSFLSESGSGYERCRPVRTNPLRRRESRRN